MILGSGRVRLIGELRRQGITDERVLKAIESVRRENFVPETFRDQAYENRALPIGGGQTISQPSIVGFMTQCLDVGERMKVLEVGTGSGYQTAILARLCMRVYSIERRRELLQLAEQRFHDLRISNITTRLGNGVKGWPEQVSFDRIMVTAAASREAPPDLIRQLSPDGIMIAPVGSSALDQHLYKFTLGPTGEVVTERLWAVRFVPLVDDASERNAAS